MSNPVTYGIQFNPTDRSYTVIINGVTARKFQRDALALAFIELHKAGLLEARREEEARRAQEARKLGGEGYCNDCDRWHVPGQHNRPEAK